MCQKKVQRQQQYQLWDWSWHREAPSWLSMLIPPSFSPCGARPLTSPWLLDSSMIPWLTQTLLLSSDEGLLEFWSYSLMRSFPIIYQLITFNLLSQDNFINKTIGKFTWRYIFIEMANTFMIYTDIMTKFKH